MIMQIHFSLQKHNHKHVFLKNCNNEPELSSSSSQAVYVSPSDGYDVHWPLVRGHLNVHAGPGGSLTAVLADLEAIWGHVINKQLEIPLKDLKVGGGLWPCDWSVMLAPF